MNSSIKDGFSGIQIGVILIFFSILGFGYIGWLNYENLNSLLHSFNDSNKIENNFQSFIVKSNDLQNYSIFCFILLLIGIGIVIGKLENVIKNTRY